MSVDHRWLVLRLEGPLLAFGGVRIDHIGVTRDFPAASMLTGLFANALGYRRTDWEKHQFLQDRMIFAAKWGQGNPDSSLGLLIDVQNAKLEKNDQSWTTHGKPEGRSGSKETYDSPHRRQRYYHMDGLVIVVLRLEDGDGPDLDALARALDFPKRPLFIGRKPCLPTSRICDGFVHAADAFTALGKVFCDSQGLYHACWPVGQGPVDGAQVSRIVDLPDLRNWRTGLHSGSRRIAEGRIDMRKAEVQ